MIRSELVDKLKKYAEFIPLCPEVEIGLGVPRRPIRIVVNSGDTKLVQPANNKDVTNDMIDFTKSFLDTIRSVDGFILKSKSPSCGVGDVKLYSKADPSPVVGKGNGLFGGEVKARFSELAVEDEARLLNPKVKEHFLTKLFTLASFRELEAKDNIKGLMDFHANNKYLMMAYNQNEMHIMGKLIGTQKDRSFEDMYNDYKTHLYLAFARGPKFSAYINILHHTFGYVSKNLTKEEKGFFLDMVEMYREDRTPLSACLALIKSWVVRFNVDYLANQTIFEPYPLELGEPFDTARWRNYWK